MKCYLRIRRKPSKASCVFTVNIGRLLILVLGICTGVLSASAQNQRLVKKKTEMRIVKTKPSVFITYDHQGKREPLKTKESNHGVWLRLHNNTTTALFFAKFSVPTALGTVGMFYDIVSVSEKEKYGDSSIPTEEIKEVELPVGYTLGHTSSAYLLRSGQSVLFSVPREHLPEGVALQIEFNYEWELEGEMDYVRKGEPRHFVFFFSSSLPK